MELPEQGRHAVDVRGGEGTAGHEVVGSAWQGGENILARGDDFRVGGFLAPADGHYSGDICRKTARLLLVRGSGYHQHDKMR